MKQHASDLPQHDGDEATADGSDVLAKGNPERVGGGESTPTPSASVKLAETPDETDVRVGSPFAVDPVSVDPTRAIEAFYDVGPIRYTAMGAVAASIMVLGFAAAAAWWFPVGGALIAALGCVLSIFGMYSAFRITSAGLLAIHLSLFVLSYMRSLA